MAKGHLKVRHEWLKTNPEDYNRRRGLSTADAMEAISTAIRNPETPVPIRDHTGNINQPKVFRLISKTTITNILESLDFEGFTINDKDQTLTFSLLPKE